MCIFITYILFIQLFKVILLASIIVLWIISQLD